MASIAAARSIPRPRPWGDAGGRGRRRSERAARSGGAGRLLLAGAALVVAGAAGCAGGAPPAPSPGLASTATAPRDDRSPAAPTAAASGAAATTATAPPGTTDPGDTVPPVTVRFARELDEPVTGLALGERRVAAMGAVPYLRDRGRWRPIPLPASVTGAPRSRLDVYMGRDDFPRIMGHVGTEDPATPLTRRPVYLRYRATGWGPAGEELGRLGGERPGALFGVLGYDDPEVVCKEGDVCLVKRRTGWSTVAGIELMPVRLAGSAVFARSGAELYRLEPGGFAATSLEVPAPDVRDVWATSPDDIWVIVERPPGGALLRLTSGQVQELPLPIAEPRALWAAAVDDLWVVGDGGIAWFDGQAFRRVLGADPPLRCVVGRGRDTLWVGGAAGVFRREAHPDATAPAR